MIKDKVGLLINRLDRKGEFDDYHKRILQKVVIKAYEYLHMNLKDNYKDYNEFEGILVKRLHSIELRDSIGNERTNGKYQFKKIILKKTLLTDDYLFMFIFVHELSHCVSESLFAIGLIPSAPLLGFIARRFLFHYINELLTDYIAIQILGSDAKVIEHKVKLYDEGGFYDATLFYKGDTYPELSSYADGINFVYFDLKEIYLCKNRNIMELLLNSKLKKLNKKFLNIAKRYKQYCDMIKIIDGVECFSYSALKILQDSFEEFINEYLKQNSLSADKLNDLITILSKNRFYIKELDVNLNDNMVMKLSEIIDN